jgi:hypothetical protein
MLDHPMKVWSFQFLQRAKSPNLANKNKKVVGVALTDRNKVHCLIS